MKEFAVLLESLVVTPARNAKIAHIVQYFRDAPDPDRGYALAVLTNTLSFKNVKSAFLKNDPPPIIESIPRVTLG